MEIEVGITEIQSLFDDVFFFPLSLSLAESTWPNFPTVFLLVVDGGWSWFHCQAWRYKAQLRRNSEFREYLLCALEIRN